MDVVRSYPDGVEPGRLCLAAVGNTKRRPSDPKPDETGHVWDGNLTEFDKPLPRWWINLFYITIVFAVAYLIWFGVGQMQGLGHWSSKSEWALDNAAEEARLDDTLKLYAGKSIDVLAKDPAAVSLGRTIFVNRCATCHGSGAHGAAGYPEPDRRYLALGRYAQSHSRHDLRMAARRSCLPGPLR